MSIARPWSICHHPSARFTRVITLKLRPLHRMGCSGALSDECFKEPCQRRPAVRGITRSRRRMRDSKGAATNSRAEGLIGSGVQVRRTEGNTELLAPQDFAAECVGVGVVGHGVIDVTRLARRHPRSMWVRCANFRYRNPAWSTGVSLSHTRSRGPKVVCRFSSRRICAPSPRVMRRATPLVRSM